MQICKVVGTVVSSHKNSKLEGAKLLLVQPETPGGEPRGVALLAIDSVGAGVGERVLVVIEGKAAGAALGKKSAAVDAAIVGIVDSIDFRD
jgi:ethanolamine utilization protein EutN